MLPRLIKSNRRAYSNGFKPLRRVEIDELSLDVQEFEHVGTGARYYHLGHATSADAFSIAFRTLPENSTGLPHILEHTTLCGSEAFPVRDPFFKMLNRSLAVYMNAWTGSDFTQYPFVTENRSDYANLRRVYLDAVFKPLLKKEDFLQEGWRFLVEKDSKDVKIGGIVYNEMKGALSDPDSYFLTRFQQARFGSESIYSVVSGGDPREIPLLKHEDLVAFHRHFYHPSNSVTVSTGKQPFDDNLRTLEEYFADFKGQPVNTLHRLKQFSSAMTGPARIEITGPVDPLSPQTRMLVSFLANDVAANPQETFNLKIMSELLFEGPAAPFYQSLIDSGLGSEYAPGTGYDTSTVQATFSVGLQGLSEDKLAAVEDAIDKTFKNVRQAVHEIFNRDRVETVLHQIELGLRHTSASHFGLNLTASVTQSWIHGGDPIAGLSVKSKVDAFKEAYAAGGLFESLLDRYVFSSSRLCFIMRPDPGHASKLEAHEEEFIVSSVKDDKTIEAIVDENSKLTLKQNSNDEAISCLPCLKIDQVSEVIRDKAIQPDENNLYESVCKDSNGLLYFKSILPLSAGFEHRQTLLLPLLMQCLSELGGSKRNSAAAFDSEIKRFTGGLNFSLNQSCSEEALNLMMSSFAFEGNGPKMLDLLQEALVDCNFYGDLDRIKTLISASAAAFASSIAASGNRFAALKAASAFDSQRSKIAELLSGISQAHFLNELQSESIEKIARELSDLRNQILAQFSSANNPKTAVVYSDSNSSKAQRFKALLPSFYETLKLSDVKAQRTKTARSAETSESFTFIPGPFSSNYSAMVLNLHNNSASSLASVDPVKSALLTLTAKLLRSKYLHREIREKGGAYGSAASFSPLSGQFTFSSYRDPTPLISLQVFKQAARALLENRDAPDEQDLLGAKLSVFSDLDAPVNVSSRGLQLFLYGEQIGSDQQRQMFRNALRSATLNDVKRTIESLLITKLSEERNVRTCVIGEEAKLSEFENDSNQKWAILK